MLPNLCIKYTKDGVLFIGKKREDTNISELPIYCIDLTTCRIIEKEKDTTADLLTVMQKSFRTALKIWDKRHSLFLNVLMEQNQFYFLLQCRTKED